MNSNESSRRQMLGLGAVSLGALALGRVAKAQTAPAMSDDKMADDDKIMMAPSASDLELLRTALGVEQVGAAFYAQVLGAQDARSFLSPKLAAAATQMAQSKNAHVAAIAGALGDPSLAPNFKFPRAAFVSPVGMTWLGYVLEEIAIGSHLSALDTLSSRSLRPVVAQIIGANSANAALLRTLSGTEFSPRYFESKMKPAMVEMYLSAYRA